MIYKEKLFPFSNLSLTLRTCWPKIQEKGSPDKFVHKFWKVTPAEVWAIAKERMQNLRAHSFSELCALPSSSSETVFVQDQKVETCIWRDLLADGSVRVIVQAYRYRLLGGGTMAAEGFIMSPDGSLSDVPEKMMYEFI